MTTRWEPAVYLLATGSIVPNLHYGPFLCDWWYVKFNKENEVTKQTFYPFRVGYKCKTEIKGLQITTRIVQGNMLNSQVPGFCCEGNRISGNLSDNPTQVINSFYDKLFAEDKKNTRYSGLQIMGFDNQTILSELISDITFQLFNISINKLSIIIHSIGVSLNKDWGYAGEGYSISMLYNYKKEKALFYYRFKERCAFIEIYKTYQLDVSYYGTDSDDVWSQTGLLKAISKNDNIIELHQSLGEIYPKNYEISDRELRVWYAILNATECTNITPFNCQESKRSLDNNKRGPNGKQRILSIIADSFPYQILRQKLQISPNTINTAKMYAKINGYGCSAAPKPPMRLKNGLFIYKDDLGKLCSICSQYGYDVFFDLMNLVRKEFDNIEQQGPHAEFIYSCPLPGFGKPNYISPTQIYKLLKSDIEQLQPEYLDHTVPQETWMMPICRLSTSNSDSWDLRQWTTAKLHEELENLNIPVNKSMLRSELVKILKTNLCLETLDNLENNISNIENTTESTDLMDVDKSPDITLFSLPLGWALKHNQKYGKKEGKRLSKKCQANSSDRYTASDMHNGLLELVESGEINEEDIPTQSTIENWINHYSQESKKEAAEQVLLTQVA
ncbi:10212_t:CDS:2, partial [Cetraspora pellucida]